ncbi:MAG: VOC family protein [Pseudoclavibacter sp.]
MGVTSVYPVLMSADAPAAASFYRDLFGFEVVFDAGWYVSMRHGAFELAVVAHDHETVPADFRATAAADATAVTGGTGAAPGGVIVNVEVDDVDAVHERIVDERGIRPVLALRDEAFGQRHFIVEGPDRVLVDVIQPIEPSPEFAAAFA